MQRNITHNFSNVYTPVKAILIYQKENNEQERRSSDDEVYVESYDIGRNGRPVNAHPLSLKESLYFSDMLRIRHVTENSFLKCRGILPANLLYLEKESDGFAIWHTPPMERELFFVPELGIPCGHMKVPAMLWKGSGDQLSVFALNDRRKPMLNSPLFHAPYFNMYSDGRVCMGTVKLGIHGDTCLEDFIGLWEKYFFSSYFSHTIGGGSIAGMNIVQLWQQQAKSGQKFPGGHLVRTGKTLKDILV
ncbi:PRTRC genetic system protein B [Mucilaginibacter sp. SG538B]|uniref:PRTRC system protein B n=1 Tax=Mucilaginibacter sp. SG538B TaxID=2587021 RepID=UPI00159DCAB5|nr:PRTRC system protein B [Mucilaginibacter sp. SG538B]NVM66861.1 PRTRC genetic system protein B [Mucilaginibacter sp. SG538B]